AAGGGDLLLGPLRGLLQDRAELGGLLLGLLRAGQRGLLHGLRGLLRGALGAASRFLHGRGDLLAPRRLAPRAGDQCRDARAEHDHADDAAHDHRKGRVGLPVTGGRKTLDRADQLVLPAGHGVLRVHAIDQLIDVGREVVLTPIGLVAHVVQALLVCHHCLRVDQGLLCRSYRDRGYGSDDQPWVRARKSSAPPTSSTCPVSTSAVAIFATSAANSSTEYSFPAASRRCSRAPGRARSSRVAVTVPSIMSPETTTKVTPLSRISGRRSVRAVSPARLERATCSYSGMVSTSSMKCAWWLVTNTTRPPAGRCARPASSAATCASRFSRM